MNHNSELELQSYLDGELSPREAARVAEWLTSDAEARNLFAELQNTKGAVLQNELELKLPESREFYWSKIERQIQREAQQERRVAATSPVFAWRKFFMPLAGAVAMLALLMVSVKSFSPSANFDEITSTSDDMEALTFHDQSAGMTVVWLQERSSETAPDIRSDVDTQ